MRIHKVTSADIDIAAAPVWQMYKLEDGKLDSYKITPQVLFGMMVCRRALYEDLGSEETAFSIVEKYMGLGDSL